MDILMLGNGFDLAHGLPTKYTDFLEFCKMIKEIYTTDGGMNSGGYWSGNMVNREFNFTIRSILERSFDTSDNIIENIEKVDKCVIDELYSHIKDNAWIEYFLNEEIKKNVDENWIDFELEISNVIQSLDDARKILGSGGQVNELENKKIEIFDKISDILGEKEIEVSDSEEEIDKAIKLLATDLNRLTRALEIYLAEFVSKIELKTENKVPEINELNLDHVLSFNYTDTYEKIYGVEKDIEYDYIHGEASVDKNIDTCNLVLGVDEYLKGKRKDKEIEFVTFKKYFQRIYKGTGGKYLDWVSLIKGEYRRLKESKKEVHDRVNQMLISGNKDEAILKNAAEVISKKPTEHNLYIFGHSLDVTDKDVIKSLICNDNVYTKIYYYRKTENDKTELGKLIKNLVKVIGQKELIKRTGGPNKTIEFIPQRVNIKDEKRL